MVSWLVLFWTLTLSIAELSVLKIEQHKILQSFLLLFCLFWPLYGWLASATITRTGLINT